MTVGLAGSGTALDPWLIATEADARAVLRDSPISGHYALVANIEIPYANPLSTVAMGIWYAPKVLDLRGFTLDVTGYAGSENTGVVINVHFLNGVLAVTARLPNSPNPACALYACGCTDVRLRLERRWNGSGLPVASGRIFGGSLEAGVLIPRTLTRVMLQYQAGDDPLSTANAWTGGLGGTGALGYAAVSDVIVRRTPSSGWVDASIAAGVTLYGSYGFRLDSLPPAQAGRFTASGWWDDMSPQGILPARAVVHSVLVSTLVNKAAASRLVWMESLGRRSLLGLTDPLGQGQFNVPVRIGAPMVITASESYLVEQLRSNMAVRAGYPYFDPGSAGFVYVAETGGNSGDLSGVTFADVPVLANGINYTPRALYTTVGSNLLSGSASGQSYNIVLDTGGGSGGPVVSGDPAYLDGVVEEIHPLTGARQALSNCEVVAFERRGSDYVAMGSTYSDGIGGFRLETEVYGGGDVFAFAADFPGVIFQPGVPLNVGDRIRPALANGYVYEIVQPGTAGPAEPVWWPDQGGGTEGDIGTARARARPYYQPVGHGPLKMTLIE